MKTFGWLKKKKVKQELQETEQDLAKLVQTSLEKRKEAPKNTIERKSYVTDNCEQIIETTRQMEEFQKEYEAVTAYLSDIQRIDQIPEKPRGEIDESARKVLTLTRERLKYQNGGSKLSSKQYKVMEMNEEEIPNEVRKINEKEAYQTLLKRDLGHLEGEKGSILFEQKEILKQQSFLKKVSMLICVLSVFLFVLFFGLTFFLDVDVMIPFVGTVLLAAGSILVIVLESHRNHVKMAVSERKMGKAIGLLNRTKIKYINNQCSLDYSYSKYMVNSSAQLTHYWEEYMKQKELEKKYQSNTELLHYYNEKLMKDLHAYQIRDAEVWTHQCVALLDSKEMVEIRHRLNVRRQKLRDRMEYNMRTKEESIENIRQMLKKQPEAKEEILMVLAKYNMDLS